ncbi:MAG: glycosyltransferase family 2 protein [Nitrosopumilus sp.]|nr:glycosyltransferase family 2 protein [Nitrosopumilus sp.]
MYDINEKPQVSIIIPTYNESKNIVQILKSIQKHLPLNIHAQTIIVDDNSPDGTGTIVDEYINSIKKIANQTFDVIHRTTKNGLSSAILNGIKQAQGDIILVMDSDFSHPPQIIPKMIEALKKYQYDIVVASRYINGGEIRNWSLKRKIISKIATKIAKHSLNVNIKDPMSGFFIFKKQLLNGLTFDALGYKLLLEILVKTKNANVAEIPYTFQDREIGSSKLSGQTILDYIKSVWKLYRFGKSFSLNQNKKSVKFVSKAARFYTVGALGFLVNYVTSLFFVGTNPEIWYLQANIFGIATSITSNFFLNKIWTFEDRNFNLKKILLQFLKFIGFSSIGAVIQILIVFTIVENYNIDYPVALVLAILTAAFGNFIFNKKWTFKEKTWE